MKSEMIEAIRTGNGEITELFTDAFKRPIQWQNYITQHFTPHGSGDEIDLNHILDNADVWHSEAFQALYIACWIYHPMEKGSYMLRLEGDQLANAIKSAGKLTWRKSSHLSGTSRSARGGHDFKFIHGYGELLILVEDEFLFLKMEGHKAASYAHLHSWYVKIKTGAGEMSNEHLNDLAKNQYATYGIKLRGAENYSMMYMELLKHLNLKGNTVTFHQMFTALRNHFPMEPLRLTANRLDGMAEFINRIASDKKLTFNLVAACLRNALGDVTEMIQQMRKDAVRMPNASLGNILDRVFHEKRVEPAKVTTRLRNFYRALGASSYPGVVAINGTGHGG